MPRKRNKPFLWNKQRYLSISFAYIRVSYCLITLLLIAHYTNKNRKSHCMLIDTLHFRPYRAGIAFTWLESESARMFD